MKIRLALAGVAVAAALALVGCSTGGVAPTASPASVTGPQGTINVGVPLNVITFNPHASTMGPMMTYLTPLYDTIIRRTAKGDLVPSVATSWSYTDSAHLTFKLTLRKDVTFDDGSKVTAEAVKANILDAKAANGPYSGLLASIESIATAGSTVTIHLSAPQSNLDNTLAGPAGMLVEPDKLGTKDLASTPAGSGAYVLDPSSVPGTKFTYTARKGYWNQAAYGPKTLNLVVLADPNARLNALESGQVDATVVFVQQAQAAKAAGIDLLSQPLNFYALGLQDRAGTKIKPLASLKVRQALNYAVDRDAMVKALAFGYGEAGDQVFAKGTPAYSAKAAKEYSYNPSKAKELLKEAGYANGFTIPVFTESQYSPYLEALDGQLEKVGVKLDITAVTQGLIPSWSSGQYGSTMVQYGDGDPVSLISTWLLPTSPNNPFKSELPGISDLMKQVNNAKDDKTRDAALQKISEEATQQAWFLPTYMLDVIYGVNSSKVSGIQAYSGNSVPYVYGWKVTK